MDTTAQDHNNPSSRGVIVTTPSKQATPARRILKSKYAWSVAAVQKKVKKPSSADTLKRIYFNKKCDNAYLERKKLMKEILNMKEQHNLKMMILKK